MNDLILPNALFSSSDLTTGLQGEVPGTETAAGTEAAGEGAAGSGGAPPAAPNFLIPMALVFGIMYFLVIRPEKKRRTQTEAMLNGMKKGDKVMTTSGLYGKVTAINGEEVGLEVADGVRLRFNRSAVQSILGAKEDDK